MRAKRSLWKSMLEDLHFNKSTVAIDKVVIGFAEIRFLGGFFVLKET
jgi:hypothetical protein